jgi:hypothetical protein
MKGFFGVAVNFLRRRSEVPSTSKWLQRPSLVFGCKCTQKLSKMLDQIYNYQLTLC